METHSPITLVAILRQAFVSQWIVLIQNILIAITVLLVLIRRLQT
jgi:hypothetical protein